MSHPDRPVPLALSHTWYAASIIVSKRIAKGVPPPEAIVAVAKQKRLPDTFVQWLRASHGLRAQLCSCPKAKDGHDTIHVSGCLIHGEQNNPALWAESPPLPIVPQVGRCPYLDYDPRGASCMHCGMSPWHPYHMRYSPVCVIWEGDLWRRAINGKGHRRLQAFPLEEGYPRVMLGVLVPPALDEDLWVDSDNMLTDGEHIDVWNLLERAQIEAERFLIGPGGPTTSRY